MLLITCGFFVSKKNEKRSILNMSFLTQKDKVANLGDLKLTKKNRRLKTINHSL